MTDREFDLVLWGATGFTGRLVASRLATKSEQNGFRWAVGGRNRAKLLSILQELGAPEVPLLEGDSHDSKSLREIASRAAVVCTTVGPYALRGSELVAACADAGTAYCDLSGEVHWMRQMIDAHGARASETGARIVHACGFDSIPSDLGCLFLQQHAIERFGRPCTSVTMFVRRMRGGVSGGTLASLFNVIEAARDSTETRRVMADPYALNPPGDRSGPDGRDQVVPRFDAEIDRWTAPFVMGAVNTRIVRRSHALLGWPWGRDFRYREAVNTGKGPAGFARAAAITLALGSFATAVYVNPLRRLMSRWLLPSPGDGPDEKTREQGCFEMLMLGRHEDAPAGQLRAVVRGNRDPGYGATARMFAEAGVSLAMDAHLLPVEGGSWTPATAFGYILIERLVQSGDFDFEVCE
jgi:short subunit dehydrogenase-like uncharacterized protein